MITRAEAIASVSHDLTITTSDGTAYVVEDPINGSSDVDAAYVFDFQYAGTSQPDHMTGASQQYSGWSAFTNAEETRIKEMFDYIETIANIEFQHVTGQSAPALTIGSVTLPQGTSGIGGFGYGIAISGDNQVSLNNYSGFAVYNNTISLASGQDNLILHELMHTLSLEHPFGGSDVVSDPYDSSKYSVLSYTPNPDNGLDSDGLQLFDILALQARWGANLDTATKDDVYTGSRNTTVDVIWDAGGTDTFDASAKTSNVTLSLVEATFSSFDTIDDVAIAYDVVIENAIGGSGDDSITGNDHANELTGGEGRDTLRGEGGNDLIMGGDEVDRGDLIAGGTGNDTIYGEAGQDKIYGQEGDDSLSGGTGADIVVGNDGNDTINGGTGADRLFGYNDDDLMQGNSGNDYMKGGAGQDTMIGGSGGDLLSGDDGNDSLVGNFGADRIFGGLGQDTLHGGADNDRLSGSNGNDFLDGGNSNDQLFGGLGVDTLLGSEGYDYIKGGDGNDLINGGALSDRLYGGNGEDVFIFDPNWGADRVFDWSEADTIDLTALGLKTRSETDDNAFAKLTVLQSGVHVVLRVTGDGDNAIVLDNTLVASMDSDDFLF